VIHCNLPRRLLVLLEPTCQNRMAAILRIAAICIRTGGQTQWQLGASWHEYASGGH
jgi:hypothetical protein